MRFQFLFLMAFSVCSTTAIASDQVTTPFRMDIDSKNAQTLLDGISQFKSPSGEFKTTLSDISETTPYAVSLTGIHLTMDYAFSTPAPAGELNQWNIQSTNLSAEIVVDNINASQVIVEQSGGSTLTLTVNASCTDVHLALLPGQTTASAQVSLALQNGKPQFLLSEFKANWTPGAWTVTSMNCQGPAGFSDLLKQNAATELQSINPFLPEIAAQIQFQLNTLSTGSFVWNLEIPGQSHVSVTIQPQNLKIQPSGDLLLDGSLAFTYQDLHGTSCSTAITQSPSKDLAVAPNSLVFPVATAEALIRCGYMNGDMSYSFKSQDIPAFQSFLGNWFEKLFIWPDLLRFNSRSVFQFLVFPTADPAIANEDTDSDGNFLFDLSAPITLAMSVPESSGLEHYADFTSTLNGPASLSIQDGVAHFQQSLGRFKMSTHWDSLYTDNYHPFKYIHTSVLANALKKSLNDPGLSFTLPTWQSAGFSMAVQNAYFDNTNVTLSMDIKTLSSQ